MADVRTLEELKESFTKWRKDSGSRLAAALTCYTVLSMAPLLIVVVGLAGLIVGRSAVAQGQLPPVRGQLGSLAGQLMQNIAQRTEKSSSNSLAAIIGSVVVLYGASGVFVELRKALNTIWEAPEDKAAGIMEIIKRRLWPFLMVVGVGILVMVMLAMVWAVSKLQSITTVVLPLPAWMFQVLEFTASVAVLTLAFALMYQVLPKKKIAWKDLWLGALCTAVLFSLGEMLIGIYLGNKMTGSPYGSAESLALFLFWLYYSAHIFYYGAEFTYVHAKHSGRRMAGGRPIRDPRPENSHLTLE